MNYYFDATSNGWRDDRLQALAQKLAKLLHTFPFQLARGFENYTPYLEIDHKFRRVAIRRITHLIDENRERLVREANDIFREVMNGSITHRKEDKNHERRSR